METVKEKLFEGRDLSDKENALIEAQYLKTTATQRHSFAFESYAARLLKEGDTSLKDPIQKMMLSILGSTFHGLRYDPTQSSHLQELHEKHPALWTTWKDSSSMPHQRVRTKIEREPSSEEDAIVEQSWSWLTQVLLTDRHLDLTSYPRLRSLLETGSEGASASNEIDMQVTNLCRQLLTKGIFIRRDSPRH